MEDHFDPCSFFSYEVNIMNRIKTWIWIHIIRTHWKDYVQDEIVEWGWEYDIDTESIMNDRAREIYEMRNDND